MSLTHATPPTSPYRSPVELVARWAGARRDGTLTACDECGQPARVGEPCATCYQVAGTVHVGHLAAVVEVAGQRRTVIAERTPDGRWSPVSVLDARGSTIRAIRRQATEAQARPGLAQHPAGITRMALA